MSRPADGQSALAQFLPAYQAQHRLDSRRRQVLTHLGHCRTAALGGFALRCDHCDECRTLYHACRDRHCPKCQQRASRRWSARQGESLLPVPYFHVVFTIPHALNGWVQLHDAELYRALFHSAWTTMDTFARDPHRGLHGQLGMTTVMHTWGENLSQHVHLHCLVPGDVLRDDGRWQPVRGNYLFPVKALARHCRAALVRALRQAANRGALSRITRVGEIEQMLTTLMSNAQSHDAGRRRVHPPLSAAHPGERPDADPVLRLSCQPLPTPRTRTDPRCPYPGQPRPRQR